MLTGSIPLITSRSNLRVKQLRAAFAMQPRLSGGLVGIEGEHLLDEALRSGQAIKTVFLDERRAPPANLPANIEVLRLADPVFASATETRSPQGLAALLVPRPALLEPMLHGTPLILLAVNLQDPGNLGTLIRSAEAFGATGVLTTPGTVSPWNPKAMRASAGSVFRVPLAECDAPALERLEQAGIRLLAAVKDSAEPIDAADLRTPCALLIGNEGAGLSPDWLRLADARVTVPCPGWVESLNAAVAGSILLYEAARQRSRA